MKTEIMEGRRANGTGSIGTIKGSPNFYIWYRVNGKQIRESSGSTDRQVAENLLQKRMYERGIGQRPAQDVKNVKYEDIRDAYITDHETGNGGFIVRADGSKYIKGVPELDDFFKGFRAISITTDSIRRYTENRKKDVAGPTVRRELVTLRAILNLAAKEGKITAVPYFPMPEDSKPAGKPITPEDFAKIKAALPESLRPFFTFIYSTGCRVGAAQAITWEMVNKEATEINIPGEFIKNGRPLKISLAGDLLKPISEMLRKKLKTTFQKSAPVFESTNYRPEWSKACDKAGVGTYDKKTRTRTGVRIHDCRVSFASNAVASGIAQDDVMKAGGWVTTSTFSRYNIVDSDRLRKNAEKAGEHVAAKMNGTK